jgi:hypothetical protein
MKTFLIRIAAWTSVGFLVSRGWGFYFANANKSLPIGSMVYSLTRLTQPTTAFVLYLKPASALSLTWVAVTNAAAYVLLGLMVETVRRHHWPPRPSN